MNEEEPKPNCFVVMPFGHDASERRWYKGWYEVIIEPAVIDAGYDPILAAAEEQPGAINDEIRSHLAHDPMVVVDLGGIDPEETPNPNVMYELGIRHAFDLPVVMLAWEGQNLPFDVSNQRIILSPRDFLSQAGTKEKLIHFIEAAKNGHYYKPMEAVGRLATIEAASARLGEDSAFSALAQEVKDLRRTVASAAFPKHTPSEKSRRPTVKKLLHGKSFKKDLYPHFLASGGEAKKWSRVLNSTVSDEFIKQTASWSKDEWKRYVEKRAEDLSTQTASLSDASAVTHSMGASTPLTEEIIEKVHTELPPQPWPTGTHHVVKQKLGISSSVYTKAVKILIERGIFKEQRDGVLYELKE